MDSAPEHPDRIGRFQLGRILGRGAEGVVYEARDTGPMGRRVALKVVDLAGLAEQDLQAVLERFQQGARIAGRIEHHDIVRIYEYGEDAGRAFLAMEFVDGETLRSVLDRGDRIAPDRAIDILRTTLLALHHCHGCGVVHRDVKPANLMLPRTGGVKLTDFGIARTDDSELTELGTVIGTPAYMSPEQCLGNPVDPRTDIWACGVILYRLLTGRLPFSGNTARSQILTQVPEPPSRVAPGVPPALDRIVLRALAKRAEDRFPTAGAFAAALSEVGEAQRGSRRVLAWGAGLGVATASAAALWYVAQTGGQVPPAPAPPPRAAAMTRPTTVSLAPGLSPAGLAEEIATLPCSTAVLDRSRDPAVLSGIMGTGARHTLDMLLQRAKPRHLEIELQTFTGSQPACAMAELVRDIQSTAGRQLRLSPADGRTALHQGEPIRLLLHMPDFGGELWLDYISNNGEVYHLEREHGLPRHYAAQADVRFGRNHDGWVDADVSPPFGTDVVVAIVASAPLFAQPRPDDEPDGAAYVRALTAAVQALRARGGRIAADALVLLTAP